MGVGAIGCEVAKRLSGFDMQIIGYDMISKENLNFNKIYTIDERTTFLAQCDYLIVSLPLNDKTKKIIDRALFKLMKPNVCIINVGRQDLFNREDFITALKSNKKMSAVLDMFEIFPNPITNPFRRLSNVKVLPGVTAISQEINQKRLDLVIKNVELVLNKQTPKFIL